MNTAECPMIKTYGNCVNETCFVCKKITEKDPVLNIQAKEFVPKKKTNNTTTNTGTSESQNTKDMSELENKVANIKLNLSAKEYEPNKPKLTEKVNYNNFDNYNNFPQQNNDENFYEDSKEPYNDEDEPNDDELDMIMNDMIENEELDCEDESDDEKWFPKYKDCDCCKGFVYKCKGNACQYLGACYCKVKNECDDTNN